MKFTCTWFRSETIISREHAETFFTARDIARSRLVTYRLRSGATHVEVRSEDDVVFFDSRSDMAEVPQPQPRPNLAGNLIKRLAMAR
jgi:hypothetical protein